MAVGVTGKERKGLACPGGLWRNGDFLRLWGAESVSLFGTQITGLALPLAAALGLGASAAQMSFLVAAGGVPFLLFSLPAGVWVDRVRRRPLLIAADLGRAALLLSIPLAAILGRLRIEQLYLVAFAAGTLTVIFEVAHYAYVPALVGREDLVEGNSKLQVSHSVAEAGGPGIAGIIVQALSAPAALVLDALSFLVSAALLRGIGRPEAPPARPAGENVGGAIAAGLRALLGHPLLRPIVGCSIASALCTNAIPALFILLATRDLAIGPAALGLIFAAGSLGAVPGAMIAGPAARRLGAGPAIIAGWAASGLALLLIPLAAGIGPGPASIALLVAGRILGGLAGTIANVNQWSLRQAVTPDALQGRVTASHRFLVYGAEPLGALLGGVLGTALGLAPAILLCAAGATLAPLPALLTPLRRLRAVPGRG